VRVPGDRLGRPLKWVLLSEGTHRVSDKCLCFTGMWRIYGSSGSNIKMVPLAVISTLAFIVVSQGLVMAYARDAFWYLISGAE
jgi:hypothetical protein